MAGKAFFKIRASRLFIYYKTTAVVAIAQLSEPRPSNRFEPSPWY